MVYFLLFLPFVVVACNSQNPKIKLSWLIVAVAVFLAACAHIPNAMLGRWAGTNDQFLLSYLILVLIPSVIFIVIGCFWKKGIKRDADQT